MKKIHRIYIVVTVCLFALSCKSQTVGLDAPYNTPEGAYYKDLNNELDKFEGTWVFTDGTTTLTIILEKREYVSIAPDYHDMLVGEYSYVVDGNEIVNTLSNTTDQSNIGGSYIHKKNQYPYCEDCDESERRIDMYFNDPERSYLSDSIVVRYLFNESNPEKLEVVIYQSEGGVLPDETSPDKPRVPYGTYIMVKED